METDRFFLVCFSVMVCVAILTIGSCEIYQASLVADMVKGGADPVRASCAFTVDKKSNPACTQQVHP